MNGSDVMMTIRRQRLERGIAAMREQNVDMWIACGNDLLHKGEPMLNYLLTYEMSRPLLIIIGKSGHTVMSGSPMEIDEIISMELFDETVSNPDGYEGVERIVEENISKYKPATIALNFSEKDVTSDGLSFTYYRHLKRAFDNAGFNGEIVSSQQLMKHLRSNRSPEEVGLIRNAVLESMKIYDEARPQMKLGMSGMDIQRLFQSLANAKGYGYSWAKNGNPFDSIGTRSSYLCKIPAADVYIEPGDVVNVDFGIIVNGASSDNQRTFYALRKGETEPPEEVVHAFNTIGEVNAALARHMVAGVKSGDILKYANEVFVKNGYPERQGGFGHEIGYYAHDGVVSPGSSRCEPDIDATFLEGMTCTVEPAILTSFGRVCREEVVAVGRTEGETLGRLQDKIWLIRE